MSAQNRTLLSKLGFADADRKNSRHDRACNYLVLRPAALRATIAAALPKGAVVTEASGIPEHHVVKGEGKYATTVGFIDVLARFRVERSLSMRLPVEPSGCDQVTPTHMRYRELATRHPVFGAFPIQFGEPKVPPDMYSMYSDWKREQSTALDAEVAAEKAALASAYRARVKASSDSTPGVVRGEFQAIIEVKIARVSSGDLIRQMRVYQEFTSLLSRSGEATVSPEWEASRGEERDALMNFRCDAPRRLEKECSRKGIAVVDFDIDDEYRRACLAGDVHVVRLGRGFEEFVAEQDAVACDPVPEI